MNAGIYTNTTSDNLEIKEEALLIATNEDWQDLVDFLEHQQQYHRSAIVKKIISPATKSPA